MLPFFAWKIFSISFFISLDFYLQVLLYIILYMSIIDIAYILTEQEFDRFEEFKEFLDNLCVAVE